jgi:hypothetical protein
MPLSPGQPCFGEILIDSRPVSGDAAETVAAGDAVAFDADGMALAGEGDAVGGIARYDGTNDGRGTAAVLSGVVVANVHTDDPDGAVVAGSTLSPSPTAGELSRAYVTEEEETTEDDGTVTTETITTYLDGPVLALSDEGGIWHGEEGTYDAPDGAAVVEL